MSFSAMDEGEGRRVMISWSPLNSMKRWSSHRGNRSGDREEEVERDCLRIQISRVGIWESRQGGE